MYSSAWYFFASLHQSKRMYLFTYALRHQPFSPSFVCNIFLVNYRHLIFPVGELVILSNMFDENPSHICISVRPLHVMLKSILSHFPIRCKLPLAKPFEIHHSWITFAYIYPSFKSCNTYMYQVYIVYIAVVCVAVLAYPNHLSHSVFVHHALSFKLLRYQWAKFGSGIGG